MSLANIKTQLSGLLDDVTGVTRVFEDAANVKPSNADCPAIIIAYSEPFLTVKAIYSGTLRYSWHFDLLFLWKPSGLSTEEEFHNSIEPFPARIVQALWAALTLSGNAVDQDLTADISPQAVIYHGESYWGFVIPWTVHENIAFDVIA